MLWIVFNMTETVGYLTLSEFNKNIRPINYLISMVIQTTNKLYRNVSEEHFQYQWSFLKLRISVAKWFTVSKGSNRIVYGKSFDSDQDFKARNANHLIQIGTSALFARCFFLSPPEIKIIQQRQRCVDQRAGNPPRQIAPYIYIF